MLLSIASRNDGDRQAIPASRGSRVHGRRLVFVAVFEYKQAMFAAHDTASSSLTAELVDGWRAELATMPSADDDMARWELLRALEQLKAAAAAP